MASAMTEARSAEPVPTGGARAANSQCPNLWARTALIAATSAENPIAIAGHGGQESSARAGTVHWLLVSLPHLGRQAHEHHAQRRRGDPTPEATFFRPLKRLGCNHAPIPAAQRRMKVARHFQWRELECPRRE